MCLESIVDMSSLDIFGRRIRFSVLVGTESAELKDVDWIVGSWHPHLREWPTGRVRTMSETFLNCSPDAYSILNFTKRYGALTYPIGRTRSFEFSLADWRREQARMASSWDRHASVANLPLTATIGPTVIEAVPRDQFQIERTRLTFRCATLRHFMALEIASIPAERLRTCKGEGCGQRFVAHDLRDRYCSESCKAKERNKAKLRYWDAHKYELLAERKKKRRRATRRKKNGSRKTR